MCPATVWGNRERRSQSGHRTKCTTSLLELSKAALTSYLYCSQCLLQMRLGVQTSEKTNKQINKTNKEGASLSTLLTSSQKGLEGSRGTCLTSKGLADPFSFQTLDPESLPMACRGMFNPAEQLQPGGKMHQ